MRAISAYRELDHWNRDSDLDGSPYDVFTVVERAEAHRQLSHELHAFGNALDDRLRWIGGLHYFDESSAYAQRVGAVVPATLVFLENIPQGTARNDSIAAFAELTYEIAPRLRATAGVRYSRDGRQLTTRNARSAAGTDFCTLDPGLRDEPGSCEATLPEKHFDYVPWTLGLDFRPAKGTLVYAKASQGYRSGGYNMRGTTETDLSEFGPERVTAFEIGGRVALNDDRLSFSLALFRSLFDDMQLRQLVPLPGTPISLRLTQNGGVARIQGGELQVRALVGRLRLAGALGVTDAEYTRLDPLVEGVTLE
jgi:iron complex outermembrane receptor protein